MPDEYFFQPCHSFSCQLDTNLESLRKRDPQLMSRLDWPVLMSGRYFLSPPMPGQVDLHLLKTVPAEASSLPLWLML